MLEFNATFLVAMISFIVFMIIMNAILYKPIERIQAERDSIVAKNNDEAKITEEKAEALKTRQQSSLEKSKILAKNNFNKKVAGYKIQKESILKSAKDAAKRDLDVASAEIEGDEKEARVILAAQINNLASVVATKVLGFETKVEETE